jgi:hypothetical protein
MLNFKIISNIDPLVSEKKCYGNQVRLKPFNSTPEIREGSESLKTLTKKGFPDNELLRLRICIF